MLEEKWCFEEVDHIQDPVSVPGPAPDPGFPGVPGPTSNAVLETGCRFKATILAPKKNIVSAMSAGAADLSAHWQ